MMGNHITRCFRHGLAMNLAAPPRNPTISIVGGVNNDKRVGTVVRDIGVMVLATGIIFVMQRAIN